MPSLSRLALRFGIDVAPNFEAVVPAGAAPKHRTRPSRPRDPVERRRPRGAFLGPGSIRRRCELCLAAVAATRISTLLRRDARGIGVAGVRAPQGPDRTGRLGVAPRIRPRRLLRRTGPPGAAGSPPTASTAAAVHAGASDLRDGCETVARHPCASGVDAVAALCPSDRTGAGLLRLVSVDPACGSRSSATRAIRSALTPRVC